MAPSPAPSLVSVPLEDGLSFTQQVRFFFILIFHSGTVLRVPNPLLLLMGVGLVPRSSLLQTAVAKNIRVHTSLHTYTIVYLQHKVSRNGIARLKCHVFYFVLT